MMSDPWAEFRVNTSPTVKEKDNWADFRNDGTVGPTFARGGTAMPGYDETYFAQATSGANEGLGNTLGWPVDIMNTGIGLGLKGVNAAFGTDYKPSEKPFLGGEYINDVMRSTGSIRPESKDRAKQIVRRISQEVGASAMPGLGIMRKAAAPLKEVTKLGLSAFGSGVGAATANQLAPDNPYAEIGGQLLGGFGTGGLLAGRTWRSANKSIDKAIPTIDHLRALKTGAYKTVDDMGVQYTPEAISDLNKGIQESLSAGQIDDILNPRASRAAKILDERFSGKPQTLTELDKARQFVRKNVVDFPGQEVEGHFAGNMIDNIDEFIDGAGPNQIISGNPEAAADAIKRARLLNAQVRKYDRVSEALNIAEHKVGSRSGRNIDGASREAVRAILDNPKKSGGFSDFEKGLMERVVMGTKVQNATRAVGSLSPGGNALQQAAAILATAYNPVMGVIPGVGAVAKSFADRATAKNVDTLLKTLLAGGEVAKAPFNTPEARRLLGGLLVSQGVNTGH